MKIISVSTPEKIISEIFITELSFKKFNSIKRNTKYFHDILAYPVKVICGRFSSPMLWTSFNEYLTLPTLSNV